MLEKFCPTTSASINILEDINVDKSEFAGELKIEKELLLSGETTRKVKVATIVGKRAAVKGKLSIKTQRNVVA
jgi:cytoskeletal protein CcmA (bactofilin family)